MALIEGLRELFEQVRDGTPVVNCSPGGELYKPSRRASLLDGELRPVRAADGSVRAISAASLET